MGNVGSYTVKAAIAPELYVFTTWGASEMAQFRSRGLEELPETFGMRYAEFEFLLGRDLVKYSNARALFVNYFDTDKNQVVDKFEVMCVVCLASRMSNEEKIGFLFDVFNFNNKGYLLKSELSLMLQSITRGVYKMDQKYVPCSIQVIRELVDDALSRAVVDKSSLRKPELVAFVINNDDALAFLESWRGHASQVLLGENEKWRDLSFPANQTSLAPNREWLKFGMPTDEYVRWRRRNRTGEIGYDYLFTHTQSFFKTVDRRSSYAGDGVVGQGFLIQGILADKWLLNALATMVARPDTLTSVFAATGQEEEGRFCIQLYENGAWRSIYFDDRLPCNLEGHALFSRSSCHSEAWPCLLEKGFAKYLGSFGHMAMCSTRPDNVDYALRMLTGGHVFRLPVKDYDWCSVDSDVKRQNGYKTVSSLYTEGSLVAFGRSESACLMSNKPKEMLRGKQYKEPHELPPYGRYFPCLGCVYIKGYRHLILRDAWGLIADCELETNFDSGHCRTFKIKIEDIPEVYDTIIVSRFPDSLRSIAEARQLKKWRTEVIQQSDQSIDNPAMYSLNLFHVPKSAAEGVEKFQRYVAPQVNDVLQQSEKTDSVTEHEIRLKDKYDFSREKASTMVPDSIGANAANRPPTTARAPGESVRAGEAEGRHVDATNVTTEHNKAKVTALVSDKDLVDIAVSFSSSLDWKIAGCSAARPRIRIRITPAAETLARLIEREKVIRQEKMRLEEAIKARKIAQDKLLAVVDDNDDNQDDQGNKGMAVRPSGEQDSANNHSKQTRQGNGHVESKLQDKDENTALISSRQPLLSSEPVGKERRNSSDASIDMSLLDPTIDYSKHFDIIMSGERCWKSTQLKLLPGEYYVFVNISFGAPVAKLTELIIPEDISSSPWLDKLGAANTFENLKPDYIGETAAPRNLRSTVVDRKTTAAIMSTTKVKQAANNVKEAAAHAAAKATASDQDSHYIMLQITSTDGFRAKAVNQSYFPVGTNVSLGKVQTQAEQWVSLKNCISIQVLLDQENILHMF